MYGIYLWLICHLNNNFILVKKVKTGSYQIDPESCLLCRPAGSCSVLEYVCLYIRPQQTEAAVQEVITNPSSAVSDGETHTVYQQTYQYQELGRFDKQICIYLTLRSTTCAFYKIKISKSSHNAFGTWFYMLSQINASLRNVWKETLVLRHWGMSV